MTTSHKSSNIHFESVKSHLFFFTCAPVSRYSTGNMRKGLMSSHDYVQTLKGQKLRFPDFDGLFSKWPKGMNHHYETLRSVQNAKFAKSVFLLA